MEVEASYEYGAVDEDVTRPLNEVDDLMIGRSPDRSVRYRRDPTFR